MKAKKIMVTVLLCALLITSAGVLAACNDDNGKIKVSIGMWPDPTLTSDVEMFNKWKAAFEADYPEYEIVADPYTYSPDTITAKATSNQLPTVFQTYFTEPQKLISNGFVRDITDILREFGWHDKMDADMREALTADGKVYGIPRDGYGMGLFLNLNMLYDVGVIEKNSDGSYKLYDDSGNPLYPTSFDEIRAASELVVQNYANTYGLVVLSANKNGGWQFANMAWNFGAEALQKNNGDGTWTANLNDDGAVAALEWIKSMKQDGLILPGASYTYQDWYAKIGSETVAMAFCGSDALALPVTNFNFNLDDIAFVPMPTGDGESRYSLYGGTPYVFAANASDEQVRGAMLFLKYMGRSPETDEISRRALIDGHETAVAKGMPIIPTIRPWVNEEYVAMVEPIDEQYINVNMEYYKDFFATIDSMKKSEEPNYCQDMYGLLDNALQNVLSSDTADCRSLLTTANGQFQSNYLSKLK